MSEEDRGGGGPIPTHLRERLRSLAWASVEAAARGEDLPVPELEGLFAEPRACFVSLHSGGGRLRGCLGSLRAIEPLGAAVVRMAAAAARRDPRFLPVIPDELGDLDVEISVLTPFEEVAAPPAGIEVGTHGLHLEGRGRSGVLLPQVAADLGWEVEEFLDQTCVKAGLGPGAWRDEDVLVRRFAAEVF